MAPDSSTDDLICAGDRLCAQAQPRAALAFYEEAVRRSPMEPTFRQRAAAANRDLGRHAAAIEEMAHAARLNPGSPSARVELAQLHLMAGDSRAALEQIRQAVAIDPRNVPLQINLATALEADRQFELAIEVVDTLLAAGHRSPRLAVLFAQLARSLGREGEALTLIEDLLRSPAACPPRERAALHLAAAGLLDRMGRYERAFRQAAEGKALRGPRYNPALIEHLVGSAMTSFTRRTLARLPRATHGSQAPVFIVGMPRSGTSLLDQILASHPQVSGGGESERVFHLWDATVRRLARPDVPLNEVVERLTADAANELAADYLQTIRAIAPHASRFTEKTPWNWMHLGLIALLLPEVRVVHCRRDPMDTGLSCFMTDFANGNNFSFDLPSIAHFQRHTDRLMAHWKSALDLRILEVDYEQVVNDLEGQTQRLLKFVDLPWDERCVRFHENRRAVTSASQAQVRQPIYGSSVGRWRHYANWLEPLRAALHAD